MTRLREFPQSLEKGWALEAVRAAVAAAVASVDPARYAERLRALPDMAMRYWLRYRVCFPNIRYLLELAILL